MATITVTGGGDALQTAINNAAANDTLLIDDGIYNPITVGKNLTLSSIYGNENCIIDGGGVKSCIRNTHSSYWTGYNLYLYGLTVRNGSVTNGDGQVLEQWGGGGIFRAQKVIDCKILSCHALSTREGGGIVTFGTAVLSNCYFENCYAEQGCGAVYNINGNTKIYNCYFKDCYTLRGSVIRDINGIENCKFDHCGMGQQYVLHANNAAGSIVKNCIFKNCYSTSNSSARAIAADYRLVNCINIGQQYGGLLYMSGDAYNCTCLSNNFSNNRAVHITRTASYQSTNGTFVCNNILDGAGVYFSGTAAKPVTVANNLIGTSISKAANVSGLISTDNIIGYSATGIKNLKEYDVHLRKESNCVGVGNINNCYTAIDFEGKPWNNPPSIGAYELIDNENNLPNRIYPMSGIKPSDIAPYDAEIEYLQSTGSQWIDTGIVPYPLNSGFEVTVSNLQNATNNLFYSTASFGIGLADSNSGYPAADILASKTYVHFRFGESNKHNLKVAIDGLLQHTFKLNGYYKEAYIDSTKYDLSSTNIVSNWETRNYTTVIFATRSTNNGTITNISKNGARLHACKITKNDVIIRDFIPVRIGTIGYLYDKTSHQLFGNSGSGNFTLGPDKTS